MFCPKSCVRAVLPLPTLPTTSMRWVILPGVSTANLKNWLSRLSSVSLCGRRGGT